MNMASSAKERRIRKTGIFGPLLPDVSKLERDDIKDFRNIHLIRMKAPIKSVTEAEEILKHDQRDPQASKYLGWHLLQSKTEKVSTTEAAIAHLKRSITYGNRTLTLTHPEVSVNVQFRSDSVRKSLSPRSRLHEVIALVTTPSAAIVTRSISASGLQCVSTGRLRRRQLQYGLDIYSPSVYDD